MEDQRPTYDKANSILEIRRDRHDDPAVFGRLAKFAARLNPAEKDYRSRIIQQACDHLLRPQTENGRPLFYLRDHIVEEIRRVADAELGRYLYYRYRYDIFPQTRELDDFPPCLQIEPTSICNYRCVFCYQTDSDFTTAAVGHM